MKERRLQQRAYVYREWDEYRDPTLTNPKPRDATEIIMKMWRMTIRTVCAAQ